MTEYVKTTTAITIHRLQDNPIFGESVTRVELADEAAGFFLLVSQIGEGDHALKFELEELEMVVEVARELIAQEVKP